MNWKYTGWIAMAALMAACESPLETDPRDAIDAGDAITDARGVELAINGAYSALQTDGLYNRDIMVFPDMYADNLDFTGTFTSDLEVALRDIRPNNPSIFDFWQESYEGINRVNNILAAIPLISDLSPEDAAQFRGEALFLRALHYFNLNRYFGGVPIVTEPSSGVTDESNVPRNTVEEVYALVEADLVEAIGLLPPSGGPDRATLGAANALLARVYLEQGKWAEARDKATEVIESGEYLLVDYSEIFEGENSPESIFEIQYSVVDNNELAFWYHPEELGGRQGFTPSADLIDAYEAGDVRLDASIAVIDGNPYGVKFTDVGSGTDNIVVLRLAEMYLIRAEANAQLGADPATVRVDIDVIRARAGLAALPATVDSQDELISAVLQERRVEFAMEGQRFFDLRRAGRAMEVLGISEARLIFPIPQDELDVNPNLEQNPGY